MHIMNALARAVVACCRPAFAHTHTLHTLCIHIMNALARAVVA